MERSGISQTGRASRTAMLTAGARGSHLLAYGPRAVLMDWLAWPLVGGDAETLAVRARAAFGGHEPQLATWVAARSRITEDWLARSSAEQYVIVGAGLDSFAWRQTGSVRVFEVDHPATQAWKQERLATLAVAAPPELVWVPVDFEVASIGDELARAGMRARPTFVSWLGVIPYLSLDAIHTTLEALPPCLLAVSHGTPREGWPDEVRAVSDAFATIATDAGEPPISRFAPEDFARLLSGHGFEVIEQAGFDVIEPRFGVPALSVGNERIVLASKT
jgi:methyltransferase (TIGR00027 family)